MKSVGRKILISIFFILPLSYFFYIISSTDAFYKSQSKNETYGIKYNPQRVKLGIPTICKNWYTRNTSIIRTRRRSIASYYTDVNTWSNQLWSDFVIAENNSPYHKEKEIHRYLRAIDAESDRFVNKLNDTIELTLEITYSYLHQGDSAWTVSLIKTIDTKEDYIVKTKDFSLAQADSILSAWHLSRVGNHSAP